MYYSTLIENVIFSPTMLTVLYTWVNLKKRQSKGKTGAIRQPCCKEVQNSLGLNSTSAMVSNRENESFFSTKMLLNCNPYRTEV